MELSKETLEFVKKECDRYETRRSAIIPCLYKVQGDEGWVSPESIKALSVAMEIPESQINEVVKFYTMFNQKPVGKLHVQVCTNVTCCMLGGRELSKHLCNEFDVKPGDVSSDGQVTVTNVECLGSCGTAPMMQINEDYYEDLTPDKAVEIIKGLRK